MLHTALRSNDDNLTKFPKDITSDVKSNLSRMVDFCDDVRNGKIKSSAGAEFTDVINVGIGGSDLGPKLVTFALRPYHTGPKCHYVSNIDEEQIKDVLQTLNPKTTLVVLTSKSFKTMETVKNSETIINWFKKSLGENIEEHLVAISSNIREAQKIGIKNSRLFSFLYFTMLLPTTSLAIRRFHDVNKSGWYVLLPFTIIGVLPYYYFTSFVKGSSGKNKYGSDPLEKNIFSTIHVAYSDEEE